QKKEGKKLAAAPPVSFLLFFAPFTDLRALVIPQRSKESPHVLPGALVIRFVIPQRSKESPHVLPGALVIRFIIPQRSKESPLVLTNALFIRVVIPQRSKESPHLPVAFKTA
ncbi:MAG: hypothetical protein ACKVOK_16875, partial [Flavobacteriales bacterium]